MRSCATWRPRTPRCSPERDRIQAEVDAWHQAHPGPIADMAAYRAFLEQIGYLRAGAGRGARPRPPTSTTSWPSRPARSWWCRSLNARYALNAANARWGSLYDALYGTDAIPEDGRRREGPGYNPVRGAKVIAFARDFLDQAAPLVGRLATMTPTGYAVADGRRCRSA